MNDPRVGQARRVARMCAEAVHLRHPVCIAPWGTNRSRDTDMEHLQPYRPPDHGGPPGQTNIDNLAPLSRFPHRVKTHGHWTIRQPRPGVYEWRSPHGYRYRVDHHGTHPHGKDTPGPSRDSTSTPSADG